MNSTTILKNADYDADPICPSNEWDEFLETRRPYVGHQQTSWWSEFLKKRGWDSFGIVAREGGAICGGANVFVRSFAPEKCFYYIPQGPVLPEDETDAAELFDYIKTYIDGRRKDGSKLVSHLRLEPRWRRRPHFFQGFREATGWHEPRNTLCVDLRLSEKDILKQMKKKGRFNIRLAQRRNVSIIENTSAQGLADFMSVYNETVERQSLGANSIEFFRTMVETLFPLGHISIFLAEYQGETLAAALIVYSGDTATYVYGGSSGLNRDVMAPYLLYFEAMRKAKSLGYHWYDFGGIAPADEPDSKWENFRAFKRTFGGSKISFVPALDCVYDSDAYEEFRDYWYRRRSDGKESLNSGGDNHTPAGIETKRSENANSSPSRNTLSDGVVHELGLDNFVSVIGSSSFTLILFYDPSDTSTTLFKKRKLLQRLAHDFAHMKQPSSFFVRNVRLTFAQIDIRRHNYIRKAYVRWGHKSAEGDAYSYSRFYKGYEDLDHAWSPIPPTMINSSTFMNLKTNELPTFPSEWALFHGQDFNILNCIDEAEKIDGIPVDPVEYPAVRTWLVRQIHKHLHFAMEGVGQPRLSFSGSDNGPRALVKSPINKERKLREEYRKSDPMGTIDWDAADQMALKRKESKAQSETFNAELFRVEEDVEGETFYKYRHASRVHREKDAEIMKSVSRLGAIYLAWADCYENLWDQERKQREDERTNYGFYLKKMNEQLEDTLFSVYEDLDDSKGSPLVTSDDVPALKSYFKDILFGYGRSPKALNAYLQANVYPRNVDDVKGIELFERIREYMRVREEAGTKDRTERYGMYFRTLWVKWHAILADFHANLSRHYLNYLESHPDEKLNRYSFEKIDVYDMKDPENFALLSDYDEFQRRYVEQRKPFILSNVEMTEPFSYTLDFLVEKCGFIDVTANVKQSMSLGDKNVKGWGGLNKFTLPQELMTERRRKQVPKEKSGDNDDDKWDRSLSLEQFIALTERFDDIYLHDLGLKKKCSSLFWSQTPYDPPEDQYFRIPSVIGRYDLFQKIPQSGFMHSWPSLFIGRKGSNSKLHIDSGATGFWMYLVSGRKRWVMYDVAERPFLYERIERHSFLADVLALNSVQQQNETSANQREHEQQQTIHDYFDATYPLLNLASLEGGGYEIVQEPGQLVYIPPAAPHAVENLDDIVGISFNHVPRAGIANHLHDLIHDTHDFGALEITLRYLMSEPNAFDPLPTASMEDPLYTTFGEYVAQ